MRVELIVNRDLQVATLRPVINSIKNTSSTNEIELFQNNVLRPSLKFQHSVLVTLFLSVIEKRSEHMEQMTQAERSNFVSLIFQKEIGFRNTVLGVVLGFLTETELSYYLKHKSAINRRISQMAQQRILSTLGSETETR